MEIIKKLNGIEIKFEKQDTQLQRRLALLKADELIILLDLTEG